MALAETSHHAAPRGQTKARAGVRPGVLEDPGPRRETELGTYAALRGPKPPSPGVPSVAAPLLAAPMADGVEEAALSFLLQRALEDKRKEEQLAKEKEEEVRDAEEQVLLQEVERREWVQAVDERSGRSYLYNYRTLATRWTIPSSSSSGKSKRKRKKKRKRKTPKNFYLVRPRSSSTTAVLCAWLVILVLLLALCSFLRSSSPRCYSWAVMYQKDRYQWPLHGWFCW